MLRDKTPLMGGTGNILNFAPLRERLGKVLDEFTQVLSAPGPGDGSFEFSPSAEILESDTEALIMIELPGVLLDDISVTCAAHSVTIAGQKRSVAERKDDEAYLSNREFGAFSQTFWLYAPIDPDLVDAKFCGGVLTINLPKSAKSMTPARTIDITS